VSVTNAIYSLNGVPVSESIDSVDFWDAPANNGLFDINFAGFPNSGDQIELFGPQIFDAGNNLIPGTYAATIEDYFADSFVGPPTGEGTGTVLVAAVPEPSSIISGAVAVVSLAGLSLARRKRRAT
jgi:hypothetical protein